MKGNAAPTPLPADMVRTWNQAAADVVWHRTGVSIACRGRKQTRGLKEMTASGPLARLEEALALAQSYLRGEAELPPLKPEEARRVREERAAESDNRRQAMPEGSRPVAPRPRREASPAHSRPRREASPARPRQRREASPARRQASPSPRRQASPSPRRRRRRRSPSSSSSSVSSSSKPALLTKQEAAPAATLISKTNYMTHYHNYQ